MTFDRKVETTESVSSETITTTLQHHSLGPEILHDLRDHWLEDVDERLIIDTLIQGEIHSVVLSCVFADIFDVSCSWKIVLELMEGAGHHSISKVESFLHSISVMDVNVNVQYPLVNFQEFQDA